LFEENGPLRLVTVDGKTQVHSLDNAWTAVANVIYIDNPLGVGFSNGFSGHTEEEIAQTFYDFMKKFYLEFPEYKDNPFYITGESYGGHYIPNMALHILNQEESVVPLKGIMIGNPYVDAVLQRLYVRHLAFAVGMIHLDW